MAADKAEKSSKMPDRRPTREDSPPSLGQAEARLKRKR
jgi:hypothetical protein